MMDDSIALAKEYVKTGESEKALQIALDLEASEAKNYILYQIAGNYWEVKDFDRAIQIVEAMYDDIEEYGHKLSTLETLSYHYAKSGEIEKALKFARSQDDPLYKREALASVAFGIVEFGNFQQTLQVYREVLDLEDGEDSESIGDIPKVIAERLITESLNYEEVIEHLQTLDNGIDKICLLCEISSIYINLKKHRELLEIAQDLLDYLRKNSSLDNDKKYLEFQNPVKSVRESNLFTEFIDIDKPRIIYALKHLVCDLCLYFIGVSNSQKAVQIVRDFYQAFIIIDRDDILNTMISTLALKQAESEAFDTAEQLALTIENKVRQNSLLDAIAIIKQNGVPCKNYWRYYIHKTQSYNSTDRPL
ncbi:MAG: hypothetical protein AAGA60_12740 [Cyanobacteria bacterium P01_E01_bin.42]